VLSSLSLFAAVAVVAQAPVAEAPAADAVMLLELELNGIAEGFPVVVHARGADTYIPAAALAERRVNLGTLARTGIEGEAFVRIADIPGASAEIDVPRQRLKLTLPGSAFEASAVTFASEAGPMTRSGTGAFFNYDLMASAGGGETGLSGAFELGAFSGNGFGLTSAAMRWDRGSPRFTRLESSITFDDVENMRSLRLGDTIARGGAGATPFRFGGVQFGRSFAVQPGFVTMPIPRLSASAAVPSIVDVYVNNRLAGSREVQAGPFQISDVPIVSGDGQLSVVVRDAAGRQTVVSESYYASPGLLRQGLHDYTYEAGFLRRYYARRDFSYGDAFAATTHRYGLSDQVTVEGHAEASKDVQQASAGAEVALPGFGLLGLSFGASRSSRGFGGQVGFSFERRSRHFSLAARATHSTGDYRGVADFAYRGPRTTIQLFAGLPTSFGSLGATYLFRDEEGAERDLEYLGLRGSVRIGDFGTFQLAARRSLGAVDDLAVEATLSMPLGGVGVTAQVRQEDGRTDAYVSLDRPMPVGEGWGYRASAGHGAGGVRFDGLVHLNGPVGEYTAEVSGRGGSVAARASVAGSVGTVDGEVFAARRLTDSFAVVTVEGQENVRIYADNHLIGRTNGAGRAVIPSLRAYERNHIRLEVADLPMDASVTESGRIVRPYGRSGVALRFDAKVRRSAMVQVEIEGRGALPPGHVVRLAGREYLSAPGGEVYLEELASGRNRVEVSWDGGACVFEIEAPQGDDPQPHLGTQICRVAAR